MFLGLSASGDGKVQMGAEVEVSRRASVSARCRSVSTGRTSGWTLRLRPSESRQVEQASKSLQVALRKDVEVIKT